MDMSIEQSLEVTKLNKITDKLSKGESLEDICKSLGISLRELCTYVNKPELESLLANQVKAIKSSLYNRIAIQLDKVIDDIQELQYKVEQMESFEDSQAFSQKLTALTNVMNAYMKYLQQLEIKEQAETGGLDAFEVDKLRQLIIGM
jgi:hypothetical protein